MMTERQKEWFREEGTPQEKAFVRKYGNSQGSAGSLFTSMAWAFAILFVLIILPTCSLLYLNRLRMTHPVTGSWVGTLEAGKSGFRRAVLVSTSVNPLAWRRPTLIGSAHMCDVDGPIAFDFETRSVGSDLLSLAVFAKASKESGLLYSTLQGSELSTRYNGTEPALSGTLRRGNVTEYQQACEELRHHSNEGGTE